MVDSSSQLETTKQDLGTNKKQGERPWIIGVMSRARVNSRRFSHFPWRRCGGFERPDAVLPELAGDGAFAAAALAASTALAWLRSW